MINLNNVPVEPTNAKSVVSRADMGKHSYSEYEVEQYAYELAGFVEDCIKNYKRCVQVQETST